MIDIDIFNKYVGNDNIIRFHSSDFYIEYSSYQPKIVHVNKAIVFKLYNVMQLSREI